MSGTDYNYDEFGQFYPYFILVITGTIALPVTYSLLKPSKEIENTAPRIHSDYKFDAADLVDAQKKKVKRRERKVKRMLFTASAWLLMAYMIYLIAVTAAHVTKIWDPYEVLGVSRSADEKSIKSHYRKMSLKFHPDKVRLDPTLNQTIESVNEHWVELTKAFKSLTDEEIRNNYLQYGHPDGKQSFSMGIALPTFLIEDGYGKYTLIFYLGLLGIVLPYLAGQWWYGTQKLTKDGILVNSAAVLVKEYRDGMIEGNILTSLSGGEEYETVLGKDRLESEQSKVERAVLAKGTLSKYAGGLTDDDKERLDDLSDPARRKVLSLLWAYLGRVDLGNELLNQEKFGVAPEAYKLNEGYQVLTQAFGHLKSLVASMHVSQHLIQAIPPKSSPLLQIPYFTPKIIQAIEGPSVHAQLSLNEYMAIPASKRKETLVKSGLLTEQQFQTAMATTAQFPAITVDKAFFRVRGEKSVYPNSLVQLVIKFRFHSPGAKLPPPTEDLNYLDDTEYRDEPERFTPPLAHAPHYARDHSPVWDVFLGDSKMNRIAVPPFSYATFDKPIVDESGEYTHNVQTIRMQFGAPPQEGRYTFAMSLINDSYIGLDYKEFVTLVVEDASEGEEIQEDGEISEPGEGMSITHVERLRIELTNTDTIAGQMKALRDGKLDESDEESDTDGDVDDDTSDTNTDTEDED
jgi:translocation protein SEC63